MNVLGMMSGTSVDGIDAALVQFTEVSGVLEMTLLAASRHAMPPAVRAEALAVIPPGEGSTRRVCALDFAVGEAFAAAAQSAIAAAGVPVDLIASHGQTVYHLVDEATGRVEATLQVGQPAVIAERTGVTTAADFRPRDVAAGGQGAPLVSLFDVLLFRDPALTRAAQNIGGIGNCTIMPAGRGPEAAFAFDTGPGNSLMDHAAAKLSGGAMQYDEGGAWAARGRVDETLLGELLAHPYYAAPPPKTTGKELFGPAYVDEVIARARALGLADADLMATLTLLTARTIADAYARFTETGGVDEVIIGGGGLQNPTLMRMLAEALPGAPLRSTDDFGVPAQSKEAMAFALMGYQLAHGRPGNAPGCTGARRALPLGALTPGANFRALMTDCLARAGNVIERVRVKPA
ncbi:MAG: anhydro-N-acetylmuramic acid kinase [Anaerolineae bacterium]|nr:anhydro-N-acetylmuramic acid kinase [Anaerolineae bacterium]